MPATTEKMRFGPEGVPGVQEPLPQLFTSGELTLKNHLKFRLTEIL